MNLSSPDAPSTRSQVAFDLQLIRPDAIRPDELWPAMLRTLEPHQMLIVALTKEPNETYSTWNRLGSLYPSSARP